MRKNPHSKILKGKLKEQYLSTVTKSCLSLYIYIYIYMYVYNSLEVLHLDDYGVLRSWV